ncbi:MAG TPA: flagellar assembly peptidoglycan hydrolase FlgJ [Steroidobacteraceae bacterium]
MSSDISKTDAPVYTDLSGLSKLKRAAGTNDPKAIRAVAEQFESMFTRMMLKSMRDAVGKDPMFGSDQQEMYQGMADDQLSVQLSKGKGLGLADMLVRQLQKMGVKGAGQAAGAQGTGAGQATGDANAGGVGIGGSNANTRGFRIGGATGTPGASFTLGAKAAAAYRATQTASAPPTTSATSDVTKTNFVQDLWPQAQDAGTLLGVDPRHLIAQAALETNWGQNLPQDSSGGTSNNLFGIKASAAWTGAAVNNGTQEFQNGVASNTTAQFKAYATPTQSFQDYVALLRNNPRYAAALNTGSDVHAFAAGLQRGGYATDPDYANKIAAVANTVNSLKLSSTVPIPAKAGTL